MMLQSGWGAVGDEGGRFVDFDQGHVCAAGDSEQDAARAVES